MKPTFTPDEYEQMLGVACDALYSGLNCSGAIKSATEHLGAFKGLDADWHIKKMQSALQQIERAGIDTLELADKS